MDDIRLSQIFSFGCIAIYFPEILHLAQSILLSCDNFEFIQAVDSTFSFCERQYVLFGDETADCVSRDFLQSVGEEYDDLTHINHRFSNRCD